MPTAQQYAQTFATTHQAQTQEEMASQLAASMVIRWANGDTSADHNGGDFAEPFWSNTWWTAHGLTPPPQSSFGATGRNANNVTDPAVWQAMTQAAAAYVHETYPNMPRVPGSADAAPDANNTNTNATSAANNAANNASQETVQAGINATSAANNAANNATSIANQNSANATTLAAANIKAQTDLAGQQATERIASADRASADARANADRASTDARALADRVEKAREFDLQSAEDRRQFNVTTLTGLLNTGVQLAKNPVDWLAYQFYMENLSIPLTGLNIVSTASLLGAVPPSGPSGAGPMIGGPAVMDGDMAVAQQLGITNAGFVSVSAAVQAFPAGAQAQTMGVQSQTSQATYPQHAEAAGGAAQLDQMVDKGRATEVATAVAPNPVVDQAKQQWEAQQQPPSLAAPPAPPAQSPPEMQAPVVPQLDGTTGSNLPMATPPVPALAPAPRALTSPGILASDVQAPAAVPSLGSVTTGENTGPGTSGIYTGPSTTATVTPVLGGGTAVAPTSSPANSATPQGSDVLAAIASELGVPIATVQQLVPPNLIAGGYSKDVIMQSPVMQAFINSNNKTLSPYATAPAASSKFGSLQALGAQTGLRGGQDFNFQTYMNADKNNQGMLQGAFAASGFDPSVELEKAARASPLSNYQPGSFGMRAA